MKPRFRPSLAETKRRNQAALDWYAAMSGRERIDVGAKPKRERNVVKPEQPLERDVQKAIIAYLKAHPLVAWAERFNSGTVTGDRYVQFNYLKGCPDILGQLRTGNILAIEVKRPGGKPTPEQAAFLKMSSDNHGCAACCDSVEAVEKLLRAWSV